jgi:curved DNA-binding protein CbpA
MSVVERDPYAVLGVDHDADDATIAAAHRDLARRFHPDIAGDAATRRMMVINAAFDRIRTQERRLALDPSRTDRRRSAGATSGDPHAATAPGGAGPTGAAATPTRDRLSRRPENDGTGGAGAPPGRPSGSVLSFGRHIGWSLGEIARVDPGYLLWLRERREGRPYVAEIDALLDRIGYRPETSEPATGRRPPRGVFRRG